MQINGIECVDVDGAAQMIGVSTGRIRQLIVDEALPTLPLGMRKKWIPLEAVQVYIATPHKVGNPNFVKKTDKP